MTRFSAERLTVAVLYAVGVVLPLAIIGIWIFTPPYTPLEETLSPPGAEKTFLLWVGLAVGSAIQVSALLLGDPKRQSLRGTVISLGTLLVAASWQFGSMVALVYSLALVVALGFLYNAEQRHDA
jgi:hypothetical protein